MNGRELVFLIPVKSRLITPSQGLLFACCGVLWLWSGWQPHDRSTWLLEQAATVLALTLFWWVSQRLEFSFASKLCIAAMFCVHTIGTHYTYSLTPYNELTGQVLGSSINSWFNWERNHYDRFVHLGYGLLLTLPILESSHSLLAVSATTARFLTVQLVLASSALYELVEWIAALAFGGDLGTAYLGTQGDPWDAQADIALALTGSLIVLIVFKPTCKPMITQ